MFNLLDIHHPSYLDIGAHHPFNISNTALLCARGSRGVNVEANPDLIANFRLYRPDDVTLNVAVGPEPGTAKFYRIDRWSGRNTLSLASTEEFTRAHPQFLIEDEIEVPVVTINHIIREHCCGAWPDFLSIDCEGMDFAILASADFSRCSPQIVCVERAVTEERNCAKLLKERGYVSYARTWANMIMLREDVWRQMDL